MIYFVEDDSSIRELVVYTLENTGLPARGFPCAEDFWEAYKKELPRLVLLDIMLPAEDGLSILRKLRSSPESAELPVIMITAKGTEYDKVLGFESGADDYIPKPLGMMELVARIKRLLKRTEPKSTSGELMVEGISLNSKKHIVACGEREVSLTLKEFELLELLMKNAGFVLTRDQILTSIWGYDFDGETRTLDVHIQTLRSKLGDFGKAIKTIRGVGYKIGESA